MWILLIGLRQMLYARFHVAIDHRHVTHQLVCPTTLKRRPIFFNGSYILCGLFTSGFGVFSYHRSDCHFEQIGAVSPAPC